MDMCPVFSVVTHSFSLVVSSHWFFSSLSLPTTADTVYIEFSLYVKSDLDLFSMYSFGVS